MTAMLVVIFAFRPWAMARYAQYEFYGLDVTSGIRHALVIGAAAMSFFAAGTLAASRSLTPRTTEASKPGVSGKPAAVGQFTVVALALLGTGAWAVGLSLYTGSPEILSLLGRGRSPEVTHALAGLPTLLQALPLLGSAAATVYVVRYARLRTLTRSEVACLAIAVLLATAANLQLGTRRFVLTGVLVPFATIVFTRGGRLPRGTVPFSALGLLAAAAVPFVRSAGARRGDENILGATWRILVEDGPNEIFKRFFTSYDTEMFSYIAYVGPRLGDGIPLGLGRGTVREFLAFPLPAGWLDGPLFSDQLLISMLGAPCAPRTCPVLSIVGVAYADFALPGVMVVMAVVGYAVRRFELKALQTSTDRNLLLLGTLAGFAIVIARTNAVHATWWMIYYLLYVAVAAVLLPRNCLSDTPTVEPSAAAVPPPRGPLQESRRRPA
jgi:hypothetical protein